MTVAQTSRLLAVFGIAASLMAGCGSDSGAVTTDTVTVDNCGEQVTFPHPVERLFVNDGGMIAITLAAGATYQGPFRLPAKSGNEWIVIASDRLRGAVPRAMDRLRRTLQRISRPRHERVQGLCRTPAEAAKTVISSRS